MAGTTFGTSSPTPYPLQFMPWGVPNQGTVGVSVNPFAFQQLYGHPLMSISSNPAAASNPYGVQLLQQILQVLHIVPQQLQNLQQLEYLQQQQLQQVQQLLQPIPGLQQPSQFQQPFGQTFGAGGFAAAPIAPQVFGAQPGQVM
jgi:hypothetical protein